MHEAPGSLLAGWESFYVIIGSSAAALIGLQFVVIALMADTGKRGMMKEVDAFATPTILHFSAVLLLSSILSAPWPALSSAGIVLGILGCVGVVYVGLVIRRARGVTQYQPVLEDWIWHAALPLIAYATLVPAALTLNRHAPISLFVIAAIALLLLFIGIHNAWDTVTYIVLDEPPKAEAPRPDPVDREKL